MPTPSTIVGHLAPELDCLTAIWILTRFGGAKNAALAFVPAGETLDGRPADIDPRVVHVDTGGGRFDHHSRHDQHLCAAELVRRAVAPNDQAAKSRRVTVGAPGAASRRVTSPSSARSLPNSDVPATLAPHCELRN